MRRDMLMKFAPVACGGFSFSTTTTLIAMLTGHFVSHRPIDYRVRTGESKVRYVRDTLRAGQILVMAILLFNPVKLYILLAGGTFAVGLLLVLLALLAPALIAAIAVFGAFFLGASILMGLGFLAEQRRADSRGRVMMSRELPIDDPAPEPSPPSDAPAPEIEVARRRAEVR